MPEANSGRGSVNGAMAADKAVAECELGVTGIGVAGDVVRVANGLRDRSGRKTQARESSQERMEYPASAMFPPLSSYGRPPESRRFDRAE